MLVNLEPYGRLGNRLFLGAHLVAFSLKTGIPLLNLGFGEQSQHFPWLEGNAAFAFPWRPTGDASAAERLRRHHGFRERLPWTKKFRYWGDVDWDYDSCSDVVRNQAFPAHRDVYFRSWLFRGPQSILTHKPTILNIFQPSQTLIDEVSGVVDPWRLGSPVLVGVHVRWEDYRGTAFFIDQEGFRRRMEAVAELWPGRAVRFVLFSNEQLSLEGWGGLDCVLSPGPSPLFDLTAMSRCDFLMGPPSTFSAWASFTGDVPLLVLRASGSAVSRDDFRVVEG